MKTAQPRGNGGLGAARQTDLGDLSEPFECLEGGPCHRVMSLFNAFHCFFDLEAPMQLIW